MKFNKLTLTVLLAASTAFISGCRDDFSEMNQDPAAITTANISYLFAQTVNEFEPQGYLEYYYNAPMFYSWSGMGISTSGASEGILTLTATGGQGSQYISTLRYVRGMENEMESYTEEEIETYAPYLAAARVLTVYLGIFDSDVYGSRPYTEACRAAYGGTLTPAYDTQEDLYTLWLDELDEAISTFTASSAYISSTQDVVYGGDVAKWAKFANSLKLRIAVRLLSQNKSKALSIASEVASASCGYIDSIDDDVLFNKCTVSNNSNDYVYHWSNGFTGCAGTQSVINLMVDNLDPRVRFFYKKNYWNSTIVQGYYDAGLEIPDFIEKNVIYTTDSNGKKHFEQWGGPGEPWVRYYGMTEDWMASNDNSGTYKWYFPSAYPNAASELTIYDSNGQNPSTYTAYSTLNQMMIIGRYYTAASQVESATLPGDVYTFTSTDRPWYGMYLSAGEVNLYLAEFAMLNGQEAQAETYYNRALSFSVQEYDKLAGLNQVAYYSTVAGCFGYDPNEGAIDLKDGEIDAMLASPDYAFTGTSAEKLEKIYLQELLHFTLYPSEQYVTARRSGYPSYTSTILPRKQYSSVPSSSIPRRLPTGAVLVTDKMADVKNAAYTQQGFTVTSDGSYSTVLNTERVWADKEAPVWGAGSNY